MTFHLKIVSPERLVYEADVEQATLPTLAGQITVLAHHIPLISQLTAGEIIAKSNGREASIMVDGGFAEVQGQQVIILADAAERGEELNEAEVTEAVKRAEEALASSGAADKNYAALKASLDREMSRLRIARRYKQQGVRTGLDKQSGNQ